jgi:hypothetical protein
LTAKEQKISFLSKETENPIIFAPTAAIAAFSSQMSAIAAFSSQMSAIVAFSSQLYCRRSRGMYFCPEDRGEMASMVYNWESDEVDAVVVTDGSRFCIFFK